MLLCSSATDGWVQLWELEKAMEKIEVSGQQVIPPLSVSMLPEHVPDQVVQFSEEYMLAVHSAQSEQRDQAKGLEQLLLQRRDEMGQALEMLTRNVGQAETQVTCCATAECTLSA